MGETNSGRIDALIAQTHDPVQQATLLVLAKIDVALDANTEATQRIAEEFTKHRTEFTEHIVDEQRLIAGVRGAWWAGIALISIIQVMAGYILTVHMRTGEQDEVEIHSLKNRVIVIEQALKSSGIQLTQQPDVQRPTN